MSRYYEREVREDYVRSPSRRRDDQPPTSRDHSPEYYSGGAGGKPLVYSRGRVPAPISGPYVSGAISSDGSVARPYNETDSPLSPRDTNALLVPPPSRHRPRSLPPQALAVARPRSRSRSRSRSPVSKARHAVDNTFTQTTSGIGVGLLGAVVGGLAAREVSDATVSNRNRKERDAGTYHPRSQRDTEKARAITTVVGALVGGLGANALERRFEMARERDRNQQEAWERKWGKERGIPHYDTNRDYKRDYGRGRSQERRYNDWDNNYRDFSDDGRRPGRLRSEERYPDRS